MNLTADDVQMAVRDFFSPEMLLDFIDLPSRAARIAWGREQFAERSRPTARRLPGEPDSGSQATLRPESEGGFRYILDTPSGRRDGKVTWCGALLLISERLNPVRYGVLRLAVDDERRHQRQYMPCPMPYRTPEVWNELFYQQWSTRAAELALRSAGAKDAVLPAAVAHPALF
ncbi:hypothetical protein ACGFRG_05785 [Streptomyces sp. NPDC048696]|uniref:hypothetical protein n=1 Tax=Streptomyces sp. NPDC048696 TaxID=3365585 RepID=UPI003716B5D2